VRRGPAIQTNMSLATGGNLLYDKSTSFRCDGRLFTLRRVQQLQMIYHWRCCMCASQHMFSSPRASAT